MNDRIRLRSVALVEVAKGIIALAVASALVVLPVHDFSVRASHWLSRGARGAIGHLAGDAIGLLDRHRWSIVVFVFAYAVLRFAEGWGLWRQQEWARWLGLVSALIYVPFEIWHLTRDPGWTALIVLAINLLVIVALWPSFGKRNLNAPVRS
jgi:uncharacterized membrane protein (DUF2068 family)